MKNVLIVKSDDMFDFCQVFHNQKDAEESMLDQFGHSNSNWPDIDSVCEQEVKFTKLEIKHHFKAFWGKY